MTETDATAAPKQCELSKCQEIERYCKAVCCAVLESRCVRRGFQINIKTELEDRSFQVGMLQREAEQLLCIPWCCRRVCCVEWKLQGCCQSTENPPNPGVCFCSAAE